ncbi:Putative transmembrane protein [hydrothermal vent metagenome]|uniref:Transmembrane protein n=1 Tax=hydrothermal vent metagenome TaxID=652676 RepID=A0A3B1CUU9_9ZZZZ
MESFFQSWPWYIAGPLIGLFVPLLLLVGNKLFGISSSFDHFCHISFPKSISGKIKFNTDKDSWKTLFVLGVVVGAFISTNFLSAYPIQFLPSYYYSIAGFIKLFIGGLLVGFGTRYAGGCTSGHCITGISLLNPASIKATIAFFAGGLIYTYLDLYLF